MLYVRNDVFWEYRYIGRGDYSHKHELKLTSRKSVNRKTNPEIHSQLASECAKQLNEPTLRRRQEAPLYMEPFGQVWLRP